MHQVTYTKSKVHKAPFPYYGTKKLHAADVWRALGDPGVYIEPFAGSLAVLLNRPKTDEYRFEVVNDLDCLVANFWRCVKSVPDEVAHWADYPAIEIDIAARRQYFTNWAEENEEMIRDAGWCDPKAAGFWAYVLSSGIVAHRDTCAKPNATSKGVQGVEANVSKWCDWLAWRLRYVKVLNGDWRRAVSEGMAGSNSRPKPYAVFLDPPYRVTTGRSKNLYASDLDGTSEDVAEQSYLWAVEHGEEWRIVYCGHSGDFAVPDGWTAAEYDLRGGRQGVKDQLMFSPACRPPKLSLFG